MTVPKDVPGAVGDSESPVQPPRRTSDLETDNRKLSDVRDHQQDKNRKLADESGILRSEYSSRMASQTNSRRGSTDPAS